MSIVVTPLTETDFPAVFLAAQDMLAATHPERAERLAERLYAPERLRSALQNPQTTILLARDPAQEIVGFCKFGAPILEDCDCGCEDLKSLQTLWVHPGAAQEAVALALPMARGAVSCGSVQGTQIRSGLQGETPVAMG